MQLKRMLNISTDCGNGLMTICIVILPGLLIVKHMIEYALKRAHRMQSIHAYLPIFNSQNCPIS